MIKEIIVTFFQDPVEDKEKRPVSLKQTERAIVKIYFKLSYFYLIKKDRRDSRIGVQIIN